MGKGIWAGLIVAVAVMSSPVQAHFLTADPSAPKPGDPFGFNRYAYANNNPVVNVDPTGKNAVVVYNADGSINVNVPVNFSGSGATPQNIAAIKSDVASHWTGLYTVAGEITKVTVAVTNVTSSTPKQAINNITLVNGPTSDKAAQGASFVSGNNSGEWNMTSSGMQVGEAAHETGHLMGDKDYYTNGTDANGTRVTTALPGYSNNLMAALSPTAMTDSRNMNVILNSPVNVVQKTPPPPPPPPPTTQQNH